MATHLPAGLSPDSVDAVTELSAILIRLRNATAGPSSSSTTGTGPAAGSAIASNSQPSATTPTPAAPGGVTGTTPLPTTTTTNRNPNTNTTTGGGTAEPQPQPLPTRLLTPKDLPAATDSVKHKLQRARAAVRGLPDVQRSVAAQEAEVGALEARRRAQALRLARTQQDGLDLAIRGAF
ncbi:hypothetical protein N658DRAFT_560870 [Parathielavia hyrcaniae]|uniref:Mediator of RNA polymerase II transcription subunit 9 n=1 Tax=Parathielavia hyrcaniae TaxID=113614 RepID=A0AAN6PX18_9PEZI|nr:hypothetical protein N658DRAFT_560870 [Parathielavia hyrcaniae]